LWKLINQKLNKKNIKNDHIEYIKLENDDKIYNKKEMADYTNKYFSTIGEKISQSIDTDGEENIKLPPMNDKIIFINPTSTKEIKRIIANMKDKAGGVDNISSKVLKAISDEISEILAYIFNLCIEKCIWPDALKKAEVMPNS
jgi:guanylate kinase